MSEQSQPEPEHQVVHAVAPVQVPATRNDRLAQLHAEYADAKAAVDAATERLKGITDGIKLELVQAAPGSLKVELVGEAGPPLQLIYSERWSVDSRKLKAQEPETYVRFARKSEAWTLKAVKGGSE